MYKFERDFGCMYNGHSMVYFMLCKCDALLPCLVLMH